MKLETFNKKYNLIGCDIHVRINQGFLPRSILTKGDVGERLNVDEEYFIRRHNFKNKVRMYNQDMYYLLSRVATDTRLSELSGVSIPYFGIGLWRLVDTKILSCRVPDSDWKFFRLCRRIELEIKKRWGITFNISDILDEEAGVYVA